MPRQRRGSAAPSRSAPARPAAAPARPAPGPQQQQQRSSSTAAHPGSATQSHPPQQASQSPGLFGQMASTAAGVAVGSSIGHAVGGLFSGGSSAPAETQQDQAPPPAAAQPMDNGLYQNSSAAGSWDTPGCENDVRAFRKCMDEHTGNMSICGWYLDQLKACQAAAKQY